MKECPITEGQVRLINVLIALHREKQEITWNRLIIEMKTIPPRHIQYWLGGLEKYGFITYDFKKSTRKTIKITDDLYMLHKLVTLTHWLMYGNPKFWEYAEKTLEKVVRYLKQRGSRKYGGVASQIQPTNP